MKTTNLISINQFCTLYSVPITFIDLLHEYEMIEIVTHKEAVYIDVNQIKNVEKIIRLHFDLDINLEGIESYFQQNCIHQESCELPIRNEDNSLNSDFFHQ